VCLSALERSRRCGSGLSSAATSTGSGSFARGDSATSYSIPSPSVRAVSVLGSFGSSEAGMTDRRPVTLPVRMSEAE
jgi:hypothetical protein